jgi:hypothetical protein
MKTHTSLAVLALVGLVAGCSPSQQSNYSQTSAEHATAAPTAAPAPMASTQRPTVSAAPALLPGQPSYSSTDEAIQALRSASAAKDLPAISKILGLPENDIVSQDAARNASHAEFFSQRYDEFHNVVVDGDSHARVFIGKDNLALASPLVKVDGRWFFDSAGGKDSLIARYIDDNERAVIGVCRAYVQAQYEYYAEDRDGDDVLEYAQQLGSTKGKRDGLYWHTEANEPESPLGPLIAEARSSGYLKGSVRKLDEPKPYHGYFFQVLTRQGPHAPGGAHDYIINGHMVAGFALVAWPARYGNSGVRTFLVGANGKVLQKDLGADTGRIADEMTQYDPDSTWSLAAE